MWSIYLVKNTVKINKEIAKELYASTCKHYDNNIHGKGSYNEIWELDNPDLDDSYELSYIMNDDGTLYFNEDHYEHMDYMWHEEVQEVLKKHKVKGDICFIDPEGNAELEMYGYRFDGKGGMVKLTGIMVWEEDKQVETQ